MNKMRLFSLCEEEKCSERDSETDFFDENDLVSSDRINLDVESILDEESSFEFKAHSSAYLNNSTS